METTVGIFLSRADAERAVERLHHAGISGSHLNILTPGEAGEPHAAVPVTDTEPPGIGKALGGVVGGAIGASGGLFGTVIVASLIPGIGPVLGGGLGLAALLGGIGGAAVGVAAGDALETQVTEGLPADELWLYDSALQQGRTVLIVTTDDREQRDLTYRVFNETGAESVDAARQRWSVGLSDAETQRYDVDSAIQRHHGQETLAESHSEAYQRGFEAALRSEASGRPYDTAESYLQTHYSDIYRESDFRQGYEQGLKYSHHIQNKWRSAVADTSPAERRP